MRWKAWTRTGLSMKAKPMAMLMSYIGRFFWEKW
jgi:hypothetical protein